MIRFECPHCSKKLSIDEKFAGRSGECTGCNNRIQIPERSDETYQLSAPTPPSRKVAVVAPFVMNEPPAEEEFSEAIDDDENELDELPAVQTSRGSARAELADFTSSVKLRQWLRFYGKVNLIIAVIISSPVFLFGLVSLALAAVALVATISSGKADVAAGGLMIAGFAVLWAVVYTVAGILIFMSLTVFTLATYWAAEVLRLLQLNTR